MKKVSILLAIVLVASLVSLAMAAGPRTTGFQIQNLDTAAVDVTVYYYNLDGSIQCQEGPHTIPVGGSKSFYQGAGSPISDCIGNDGSLSSWQGSVVIEATGPIAVIANIVERTEYASGAYVGTPDSKVGNPLILPGIFSSSVYGFTGDFAVQNAGAADTVVDIQFYGSVNGVPPSTLGKTLSNVPIKAHSSYYYDMATDTDLPANWMGVAIVTSQDGAPLAGTINQKPVGGAAGALLTFDGVAVDKIPANADSSLPGLMKNYYSYWTGVQVIASANGTTGNILIYAPGGTLVHTEPFSLNQWESKALFVKDLALNDNVLYYGTVDFTAGSGTSIVSQRDMPGYVAMTYSGIYADGTTPNLSLPFIARNYWGVSTGFAVKNDGDGGYITIQFRGTPGTGSGDFDINNYYLGTGESVNLFQWPPGCAADPACPAQNLTGCTTAQCGSIPASYPDRWTGSVTVIGETGMQLSAIVNERGYELGNIGDVGQVYNGFNY